MRRSVRLRKQALQNESEKERERDNVDEEEGEEVEERRPQKSAQRRSQSPKPNGGAAEKAINEQARILATLKEAMPAELIQTVQKQANAFDEAMQLLRESGERATKQEVRCVLIAAKRRAAHKRPRKRQKSDPPTV